jgi:hypothetical protein
MRVRVYMQFPFLISCVCVCVCLHRYMRLEHLAARPAWDGREAYEGSMTKEQRRIELAKMLSTEVSVVPPSRLLVLINQVHKCSTPHP